MHPTQICHRSMQAMEFFVYDPVYCEIYSEHITDRDIKVDKPAQKSLQVWNFL